jgi:hypothetical protein
MNDSEALQAADAVLALINSQPRTPTREAIAAAIAASIAPPVAAVEAEPEIAGKVELSAEGRAFVEAAEWELGLMRISRNLAGRALTRCIFSEAFDASQRVERAARRVWGRPASSWNDVAARAVVAAFLRWDGLNDQRWLGADGRMRARFWNAHPGLGDGADELIAAIERMSGIRRLRCDPEMPRRA